MIQEPVDMNKPKIQEIEDQHQLSAVIINKVNLFINKCNNL